MIPAHIELGVSPQSGPDVIGRRRIGFPGEDEFLFVMCGLRNLFVLPNRAAEELKLFEQGLHALEVSWVL